MYISILSALTRKGHCCVITVLYISMLSALTRKGHCCVIKVLYVSILSALTIITIWRKGHCRVITLLCMSILGISDNYYSLGVSCVLQHCTSVCSAFFLYQSWPRNGQFVLFVCWSLQSEHIFFCQFESCDRPLMNNNFFLLYEVPNKVKTFPIYIHIYMHFCSLYYIDSIKIMVWVDSDNIVHIQWEITLSNKLSQSSYN